MRADGKVRVLFWTAGVYDFLLGAFFLVTPAAVFDWYGVVPPNHFGYVRFPALLLMIFGLMFFAVASDPRRNRNLIPYGILLKLAYCGVVFGYWLAEGIPDMWKPFAVSDAAFALLFAVAWRALPAAPR